MQLSLTQHPPPSATALRPTALLKRFHCCSSLGSLLLCTARTVPSTLAMNHQSPAYEKGVCCNTANASIESARVAKPAAETVRGWPFYSPCKVPNANSTMTVGISMLACLLLYGFSPDLLAHCEGWGGLPALPWPPAVALTQFLLWRAMLEQTSCPAAHAPGWRQHAALQQVLPVLLGTAYAWMPWAQTKILWWPLHCSV